MRRSSPILRMALAGGLGALLMSGHSRADLPATVTVSGDRASGESPIVVDLKPDGGLPANYTFATLDGKDVLRANVSRDGSDLRLAAIAGAAPAGTARVFKLLGGPRPDVPSIGVEMIPHDRRVEVRIDGKPVTEYIPDDGPKPYFFPLLGPSGARMTRAFPMKDVEGEKRDHPHHRSLWFTHGSVNQVDFWSEAPGHGRIVETTRPTVTGGLAMGMIRTLDDWIGPDGKKICEDERVVRFWATRNGRVVDFEVTLKASEGPVTFGDTKEGMFGLRVATSMDVTSNSGGHILTSDGIEDKAAWGKPAAWVDYSGFVEGKAAGVAILNHPSSFRYPTTWHVRDYGLFAANPFGWHDFGRKERGDFVLPEGESIAFRYRLILHEGDGPSAGLPTAFRDYAEPPKVVVD